MNWSQILTRALGLASNTNANNYPVSVADISIQQRYEELILDIITVTKGDYFWDSGKANTVANQSEYLAETIGITPNSLNIKKINKVFIKYSENDQYHTQARYVSPTALTKHPDYYKENQSKTDPFFYIQDNSYFIYPAPTEVVVWGIEIYVNHEPPAITTTALETDIELPKEYHHLISLGMVIDIYLYQWKLNEASAMEQLYDQKRVEMVSKLKTRYNNPVDVILNVNNYR